MTLISTFVAAHRDALDLAGHGVTTGARQVTLLPRYAESRHVVVLVLNDAGDRVALVAKVPRRPWDTAGVCHEAAMLERLHRVWPAGRDSIPRVVFSGTWRATPILVETAVPGRVLTHRGFRRAPEKFEDAYLRWVESLPVTGGTADDPDWFDRLVGRPLDLLEAATDEASARNLARRTRDLLEPLRDLDCATVFEHGDLSSPNLLWHRQGSRVGVIDWELALDRGLPGHDAAVFLAFAAFARAKAHGVRPELAAFRRAFLDPDGWAWPVYRAHLRPRGVAPEHDERLLLAAWARYALQVFPRLLTGPGCGEPAAVAKDALELFRTGRNTAVWRMVSDHLARPGPSILLRR